MTTATLDDARDGTWSLDLHDGWAVTVLPASDGGVWLHSVNMDDEGWFIATADIEPLIALIRRAAGQEAR